MRELFEEMDKAKDKFFEYTDNIFKARKKSKDKKHQDKKLIEGEK